MLKVKPGEQRTPEALHAGLMAPCGMNCGLCRCYLREKDRCLGCRTEDASRSTYQAACPMRTCEARAEGSADFCFSCDRFPCPRLRRFDRRYRTRYGMSPLDNLTAIREAGMEVFLASERARWACPGCGGIVCVHTISCIYCGTPRSPGPTQARATDGSPGGRSGTVS